MQFTSSGFKTIFAPDPLHYLAKLLPACLADREADPSLHQLEMTHRGQYKWMLFGTGMMSQ